MYQSDQYKKLIERMEALFDSPIAELVERTGKSRPTVSKFFNKKHLRYSSWETIYDASLILLEEREKKLSLMFAKQGEVIKNVPEADKKTA